MKDYKAFLDGLYADSKFCECPPSTKAAFLADCVFDFTTYDGDADHLFGSRAVEVCEAILNQSTFDYIKGGDRYQWFLVMVNMPFFKDRLDWGTSIRGAWWHVSGETVAKNLMIPADGDGDWRPMRFTNDQWIKFIMAIIAFAKAEE